MIIEAYCSYEVAKLLKEKGFDEPCLQMWECGPDKKYLFRLQSSCYQNITEEDSCLAPTHQMAMKWLRERYNLFFGIGFGNDCNGKFLYMIDIYDLTNNAVNGKYKPIVEADDYLTDNPKTYEDAVEAALKYCLENLI